MTTRIKFGNLFVDEMLIDDLSLRFKRKLVGAEGLEPPTNCL